MANDTLELTAEFDREVNKDKDKVWKKVQKFYDTLVHGSPVAKKNGGFFKSQWFVAEDMAQFSWTISNNAEYATILWAGRQVGVDKWGNTRMYGSLLGWGKQGGQPMLEKFREDLRHPV